MFCSFISQMVIAVIVGSLALSVPRYFEYHLAAEKNLIYLDDLPGSFEYHLVERSANRTQILQVSKNEKLFGNRAYVIGYRIANKQRSR